MAANEYYANSHPPTGLQHISTSSSPYDRTDAPLPPLPGQTPLQQQQQQQHAVSPVSTSPFDDHAYPPYSTTANSSGALSGHDTSYYGSSHPLHYDSQQADPFTDHSAIPLNSRPKMESSPTRYDADPEQYPPAPRDGKKRRKKKGWFTGRVPWVCYILTVAQIGVFVGELVKNGTLTGSPIQTKPNFNIMIGPSPYVLINMGSRFTPCMHNIKKVIEADVQSWPCPNTTSLDASAPKCTLSELCGNGGVPDQSKVTDFRDRSHEPNQWWRFIVPIFLHAGIIHIGFNMLLQLTLGRDMEREIGSLRFTLVYFSAGIFGFVLGGNYAADGITSVGASGSLFGILALNLLDLLYNWSSRRSPVKDLLFLLLDIAIAFVLGLLPGLDNFSHIGGFAMGLVLGICLLHSPQALRERIGTDSPPYNPVIETQPLAPSNSETTSKLQTLAKQPVGFFKGRKPLWWAWWLVRAGSLVAVFICFVLLLRNFYEWRNTCSWCKHLTCLPISTNGVNWCDIGGLSISTSSDQNSRRSLGLGPVDVAKLMTKAVETIM